MNAMQPTDLLSLDVCRRQQDRNESMRYSPAATSGTASKQATQPNQADKTAEMCLSRGYTSDVVVLI